MTPQGGTLAPGTPAVICTCTGAPEQTWTLTPSGQLTVGGLCLEVQDGSTAIGAIAQIDTCTGAPEQTWAFAQA